jgi:chromosome segregation ATPase
MAVFFDESQEGPPTEEETTSRPEFAVAMRGYDRVQVDDYLAQHEAWVVDAQARLEAAERALSATTAENEQLHQRLAVLEERELNSSPRSIAALGERVNHILQQAWDAAEELREQSETQAAARTADLEQHVAEQERRAAELARKAERRSADAEEAAKSLLRDARDHAERHTAESEHRAREEAVRIVAEGRAEAERLVNEAMARCDELEAQLAELAERRTVAFQELASVRSSLEQTLQDAPAELGAPEAEEPGGVAHDDQP